MPEYRITFVETFNFYGSEDIEACNEHEARRIGLEYINQKSSGEIEITEVEQLDDAPETEAPFRDNVGERGMLWWRRRSAPTRT